MLVALYEEPEKPANALDFIKQYLGAPTSGDVETMKAEKDEMLAKQKELEKALAVRKRPICWNAWTLGWLYTGNLLSRRAFLCANRVVSWNVQEVQAELDALKNGGAPAEGGE